MNGWIKLHRKILGWEWYHDVNTRLLFFHLLLTVNHDERMWKGTIILPGQRITSIRKLAQETGLTVRQTRGALNDLQMTHEVTQETTTQYSLITVKNWSSYQNDDKRMTHKVTNKRHTEGQQIEKIRSKEDKNINTSEHSSQENKVLEIFSKINPTMNWGNKTTRKAATDLIKKFGFEETLRMAEAVVSVQGKEFAPVATTPYEMKEKLAKFKIYFDQEKQKHKPPSYAVI